jgi:hypothetical protein
VIVQDPRTSEAADNEAAKSEKKSENHDETEESENIPSDAGVGLAIPGVEHETPA